MRKKNTIRLNESELKSIVKESVKNIISEKKDKESLRNGTEDDYIKKLYYNQLKCLSRAGYYLLGNANFPYRINEHMKIYGEEFSTYPDIEENIATAFKTLGFYKSYKKYEPAYAVWKNNRDTAETKRLVYLKQNPSEISNEDIQRGQTLIRAIDIMDEYSQKRAEDTEVATEAAMGMALELLMIGGAGLGYLAGQLKPIKNLISKLGKNSKQTAKLNSIIPVIAGGLLGTIASFPLQAWGAKAEVSASRKGRFEAMRKELNNPNSFAILNDEQIRKAQEISKNIALEEDNTKNKIKSAFLSGTGLESLKSLASDSKDYKKQRQLFDLD